MFIDNIHTNLLKKAIKQNGAHLSKFYSVYYYLEW